MTAQSRRWARFWAPSILAMLLCTLLAAASVRAEAFAPAHRSAAISAVGHPVDLGVLLRGGTSAQALHQAQSADPLDGTQGATTPAASSAVVRLRSDAARTTGATDVARERAPPR